MIQKLKVWGIDISGDSVDFEKPIGTYEGEAFKPFAVREEIPPSKAISLPENASGIAAFRAGEHSALFGVDEEGEVSLTASTSAVNGDNPSVKIGNLLENDAAQIANFTEEPLDVEIFFFHFEQND